MWNPEEKQAADCFTEVDLAKVTDEAIENVDTKSVILAPFNSTKSKISEIHESVKKILFEKMEVLHLNA